MPKPPEWVKPGDPPRAAWANGLVDFVRHLDTVVGPGLTLVRSGKGATLTIDDRNDASLVRTTGVIPARDGATPGVGAAVLVRKVAGSLVESGAIAVNNMIGANLAADRYGLAFRIDGEWYLIAEC